jgi:Sulfatase
MLYVKWLLLEQEGYRCVGRLLGRVELPNLESRAYLFSWPQRLSFFRWDLLLAIAVPIVLAAALFWLCPRWRTWCAALLAMLTITVMALQMHGYWYVGQFQNWDLWRDAVKWGMMHPDDASQYGGVTIALKIAALIVGVVAVALATNWSLRRPRETKFLHRTLIPLFAGLSVVMVMAWTAPMPATAYHRGSAWVCVRSLLGASDIDDTRYAALTKPQILQKWREVSGTPAPEPIPAYFGAAKDYDVLCFILETAPARCLDVAGEMPDTPAMRQLREHSWVGTNHVSSYPYTRWAVFSLMTSWYPIEAYLNSAGVGKALPGLPQTLRSNGYATKAYKPYADDDADEFFQVCQGISEIVHATSALMTGEKPEALNWRQKADLDHRALETLKSDMTRWVRADQRYLALYLPQIGHGPWLDVVQDGVQHSTVDRGKAIIALQDQWLGELVDHLRSLGRLDRTIIVVVGDHGVRTRREDPDFEGGLIAPYSFRVPLLLYVPQVLAKPAVITHMTSHIDLAPSILDLLGSRDGRDWEMGAPLWDGRLAQRKVYFWANALLGADGYFDSHTYGMWQHVADVAYVSPTFSFSAATPVSLVSPDGQGVVNTLTDALAAQDRVTRLGIGQPVAGK